MVADSLTEAFNEEADVAAFNPPQNGPNIVYKKGDEGREYTVNLNGQGGSITFDSTLEGGVDVILNEPSAGAAPYARSMEYNVQIHGSVENVSAMFLDGEFDKHNDFAELDKLTRSRLLLAVDGEVVGRVEFPNSTDKNILAGQIDINVLDENGNKTPLKLEPSKDGGYFSRIDLNKNDFSNNAAPAVTNTPGGFN